MGARSGEDVFFEKFDNHFVALVFVGTASTHLETVYSNQDELVAEGIWEWSHEVDTPNVKNFDFENCVQGHHVSS